MGTPELLTVIERGVYVEVSDKFAKVLVESERDAALRGHLITVIGQALGKRIDTITYPANWVRLLRRKDCPAYMKELIDVDVTVYYPKLPLPEEEHWVTFESPVKHKEAL